MGTPPDWVRQKNHGGTSEANFAKSDISQAKVGSVRQLRRTLRRVKSNMQSAARKQQKLRPHCPDQEAPDPSRRTPEIGRPNLSWTACGSPCEHRAQHPAIQAPKSRLQIERCKCPKGRQRLRLSSDYDWASLIRARAKWARQIFVEFRTERSY